MRFTVSAAGYVTKGKDIYGEYAGEETNMAETNEEMTLDEIGTKYHLTRERVRQIKEKAIRRLRTTTNNKLLKSYLGQ